jgi:hypothetical protein
MAETPDNNTIEKLLKDYARQRRESAGNPELHPANRRMLQAEVRQQFAKTGVAKPAASWVLRFWPRIAFGTAVFALLAIAIYHFAPRRQETPEFALAKAVSDGGLKKSKNEAMAPAAPAPEKLLANADSAVDHSGSSPTAEMKRGALAEPEPTTNWSAAARPALAAAAPVREPSMTGNDKLATALPEAFATTERQPSGNLPAGPISTGVEQSRVEDRARSGGVAGPRVAMSSYTAAGQMQVLTEFTVQQSGEAITVVDRDGSIYKGYARLETAVEPPTAQAAGVGAATGSLKSNNGGKDGYIRKDAADIPAVPRAQTTKARNDAQVANQAGLMNYSIYAEGTNRSLNQRVILKGNLMQFSVSSNAQVNGGLQIFRQQGISNLLTNAGPVQSQTLNGIITGRLQLGPANSIEFNANSTER